LGEVRKRRTVAIGPAQQSDIESESGGGMSQFRDEVIQLIMKWHPDCKFIEIKVDKTLKTLPATVDLRVVE
jgi:hypothetical protein